MKPFLKAGDIVEIIAPASKFDPLVLDKIKSFLEQWGLQARFVDELMGEDLLFANSDAKRFAALEKALNNPNSKAIWAVRGGYGCARLIPYLDKLKKPSHFKWLMGFSDITALHIYLNQKWAWPSLHCASANQIATHLISEDSINCTKDLTLNQLHPYTLELEALNKLAGADGEIVSSVTGGNLCVLMTSLATNWQIDTQDKILMIEDVNEEPYRIDRMLTQLSQAGLLANIKALLLGEFSLPEKSANKDQMQAVLQNWASLLAAPVLRIKVGHGFENYPIPLASKATLKLGQDPTINFS